MRRMALRLRAQLSGFFGLYFARLRNLKRTIRGELFLFPVALLALHPQPAYPQQTAFGLSLNRPATRAVTTASSNVQMGTQGGTALIWNTGTQPARLKTGTASNTAALVTDHLLPAGACVTISVAPSSYLAAITASGSTTLEISQGFGPLACGVPGSGAGGGGSAVTIADGADTAQGTTTDAACATDNGTCTELALLKRANQRLTTLITAVGTPIQATGGVISLASQYPSGATAISASSTGTTGATTATLAGTSGKTTYICGFSIRANATAAATGNATITGTVTGTLNFTQWTAPLASGLGINEQVFVPCLPASAQNTGIAIISAAPGAGGVVSSTGWGYQL